jgi:hypothetical protein
VSFSTTLAPGLSVSGSPEPLTTLNAVPPDFLNSREDAILLLTLLIVGYATYKDPRGIGAAFLNVLRAALHPKVLLLLGSALVYAAAVVFAAKEAGLWHTTALKTTIYWFVGTAVVLMYDAVTRASRLDGDFTRRVFKRVLSVTILIEFAVNLYAFPLAVELIGVGIALTFAMLQVIVAHDPSADPRVGKLIEGVLATVGLVYLGYFAVRGVGDLLDGVTRERGEEFLVGPGLTIALIPLLYLIAWWSRREQRNLRKRLRARHGGRKQKWSDEDRLAESDRAVSTELRDKCHESSYEKWQAAATKVGGPDPA